MPVWTGSCTCRCARRRRLSTQHLTRSHMPGGVGLWRRVAERVASRTDEWNIAVSCCCPVPVPVPVQILNSPLGIGMNRPRSFETTVKERMSCRFRNAKYPHLCRKFSAGQKTQVGNDRKRDANLLTHGSQPRNIRLCPSGVWGAQQPVNALLDREQGRVPCCERNPSLCRLTI